MKIKNIKVNSYGNLEEKEIQLKNGINIIYGKNESGKSTLLSYMSNMFYGISKNKDGRNLSEFERYKPWFSNEFSGKISYELDNGKEYEIYRDFNKKNPKIYNEKLEDISDRFDIDKKDGSKFFTEQTGVDRFTYLSTVVSAQQEVRLDDKTQNILVQKIANLAGTGDDNVSYKNAVIKLQEKIRDEIGTNKTIQKPINIVKNNIDSLEKGIESLKQYEEKQYYVNTKKEELKGKLVINENKKKFLTKICDEYDNQNSLKQKIDIDEKNKSENGLKIDELTKGQSELEKKLEEINVQIEESKKRKEQLTKQIEEIEKNLNEANIEVNNEEILETINNKNYIIICVIAVIALAANFITIKNMFLTIISIIALVINVFSYIIKYNKTKKYNEEIKNREKEKLETTTENYKKLRANIENAINQNDAKIDESKQRYEEANNKLSMVKGQIMLLERNNENIQIEIEQLKNILVNSLKNKKEEIKLSFKNLLDNETMENLANKFDLKQEINNLSEEINSNKILYSSLEMEERNISEQLNNMVEMKEQLEMSKEKLDDLKVKENIINIALENLNEAYEEMKTTITPKFTKNLSNNVSKISDGKYTKVTINDEKGLIIENEKGEYVEAEKLSIGTIDELYLSLRLSMVDELSKEKLPIILDETFAYFDNQRMKNALRFLYEELNGHQIIIFTCSNREREQLNEIGLEYNYINL